MDEDLREKRHTRTLDRIAFLQKEQFNVVEMWECQFKLLVYSGVNLDDSEVTPEFTRNNPGPIDMDFILSSIESGKLFGAVEVDIEVPSKWPKGKERECTPTEYFSEMSPIFCTTNIGLMILEIICKIT